MPWLCLALIPVAFAIACPMTALMIALGRRWSAFDAPGVPGQVKAPVRKIPNTGGIAIFTGIALPMLAGLFLVAFPDILPFDLPDRLAVHLPGIRERLPLALGLLASLALLHTLGLIDDRRPLGPWIKLAIMALPAAAIATLTDTRLLMLLDAYLGERLGSILSIALTVLWFLIVTNAMNFMDNTDGLAAGVAAVAAGCFLAAALIGGQWFIAATLALLIGSALGFLVFNFPRPGGAGAKIFMGDGGSLVLGFLLAFLTTRTTYLPDTDLPSVTPSLRHSVTSNAWYALLMPLVILAVPLYDFISVVLLRLSQGRSPFVGDLQHFSHRLIARGLSRSATVLVICGLTAVTGLSGIALGSLAPWQAALAGAQTLLILAIIALFEYSGRARGLEPPQR